MKLLLIVLLSSSCFAGEKVNECGQSMSEHLFTDTQCFAIVDGIVYQSGFSGRYPDVWQADMTEEQLEKDWEIEY